MSRPRWLRWLYLPGEAAGALAAVCAILLVLCVLIGVFVGQLKLSVSAWQDLRIRLYGPLILFGVIYAAVHWCHVRMDLLRTRFGNRGRLAVELAGLLLLQLPVAIFLTRWGWQKFVPSLRAHETGGEGGLPMLWISKGVLPIAFGLLVWVSVVQLVEIIWCWRQGRNVPEPKSAGLTSPDTDAEGGVLAEASAPAVVAISASGVIPPDDWDDEALDDKAENDTPRPGGGAS